MNSSLSVEQAVFRFAGMMILISLVLTTWVSPWFVWFSVFIGVNLVQYSFTGFCPAAILFQKMGLKPASDLK